MSRRLVCVSAILLGLAGCQDPAPQMRTVAVVEGDALQVTAVVESVDRRTRDVLLRGRALPFIRRWIAGTVFVGLGLIAATARRSTS